MFNGIDPFSAMSLSTNASDLTASSHMKSFFGKLKSRTQRAAGSVNHYLSNSSNHDIWMAKTNDLMAMQPILSPVPSVHRVDHWLSNSEPSESTNF